MNLWWSGNVNTSDWSDGEKMRSSFAWQLVRISSGIREYYSTEIILTTLLLKLPPIESIYQRIFDHVGSSMFTFWLLIIDWLFNFINVELFIWHLKSVHIQSGSVSKVSFKRLHKHIRYKIGMGLMRQDILYRSTFFICKLHK